MWVPHGPWSVLRQTIPNMIPHVKYNCFNFLCLIYSWKMFKLDDVFWLVSWSMFINLRIKRRFNIKLVVMIQWWWKTADIFCLSSKSLGITGVNTHTLKSMRKVIQGRTILFSRIIGGENLFNVDYLGTFIRWWFKQLGSITHVYHVTVEVLTIGI